MKLRNWFLRQLAEKDLIEWNPDYYNEQEKEVHEAQQEQLRKLEAGEEIAPLWHGAPSWNNPARFGGDSFDDKIWAAFWAKLTDEEKRNYIEKHKPSPEDWYQVIVKARTLEDKPNADSSEKSFDETVLEHFNLGTKKEDEWLADQKKKLESNEEIEPPWIAFPISLPSVGWDDYFLESWKLQVWIPFWDSLSEDQRKDYLRNRQPPNAAWLENITENWTGKLRKTEDWLNRQKSFLENKDEIYVEPLNLPRFVFPHIPSEKTVWDENFIDRWLAEVWLPFWNNLTDEEQDEQLKFIETTDEKELERLSRHEVKNIHKFKK